MTVAAVTVAAATVAAAMTDSNSEVLAKLPNATRLRAAPVLLASTLLTVLPAMRVNADGPSTPDSTVHIWFKAFIPREHPKLPAYVSRTAKNTWVIHAPDISAPPLLDISRLKGTCFETDNRLFDSSPAASARVSVDLTLAIDDRTLRLVPTGSVSPVVIGETRNVDCRTGEELQPGRTAATSSVSVSQVKKLNFLRTIGIKASSANPFYTIIQVNIAPRIDFDVVITYDILSRHLLIKGDAGYFPSFEGYYQLNGGPVTSLVQWTPFEESTAMSLLDMGIGVNLRNFDAEIRLPNKP